MDGYDIQNRDGHGEKAGWEAEAKKSCDDALNRSAKLCTSEVRDGKTRFVCPKLNHKAVGIVAEYNPFHNGHLYHLERAKALSGAELCVVVMSGSFTQRGQLSIMDKWSRAESAVRCGADLVVELPTIFACANASIFAGAAVEILEGMGVDTIAFGSENGDSDRLRAAAKLLDMADRDEALREKIWTGVKSGLSYPRARLEALREALGREEVSVLELLTMPNDILAVEYMRSMKNAEPLVIRRQGAGYMETDTSYEFSSATGIRAEIFKALDGLGRGDGASAAGTRLNEVLEKTVPPESRRIILQAASEGRMAGEDGLFRLLQQKISEESESVLNGFFGAEEGLGGKAKAAIRYCRTMDDLTGRLKSKRYTYTRIRRMLIMLLLGIRKSDVAAAKPYGRILAFSQRGASLHLNAVKRFAKSCDENMLSIIPIITNVNKDVAKFPEIRETFSKDILATDLYNIACGSDMYKYSDYVKKPLKCGTK